MTNELPIIQKTFDMLLWLIPKINQFSKRQKFLLGERIERTALDYPPGGVACPVFFCPLSFKWDVRRIGG